MYLIAYHSTSSRESSQPILVFYPTFLSLGKLNVITRRNGPYSNRIRYFTSCILNEERHVVPKVLFLLMFLYCQDVSASSQQQLHAEHPVLKKRRKQGG